MFRLFPPAVLLFVCTVAVAQSSIKDQLAAGRAAVKQGRYTQAEQLLTAAVSGAIVDSAESAEAMNELGHLYCLTAKYEDAENLDRKALALEEKLLGKDSPAAATSLEYLGELDTTRARLKEAEAELRRALEIRTKAFGEENADTAETMSNFGYVLLCAAKLDEAEKLCTRAMEIQDKVLSAEDTRRAVGWDNLGNVFFLRSRLVDAEALNLKSLHLRTSQLGEDHPDVGQSYDNLGWLYMNWGDTMKARRYFNLARFTRENSLGADHPDTIESHASYVQLSDPDPIKPEESGPMLEKDLAAETRILGPSHWTTLFIQISLAQTYTELKRNGDAEKLYKLALAASRQAYGEDHFVTAMLEGQLAEFDTGAGQHPDEAEPLYKQSIATTEKLFGKNDRSLAETLNSYAEFLRERHRNSEATAMTERAAAIDALDKKRNPQPEQLQGPGL